MSFLREIITSAEEVEVENLKVQIPELKQGVFLCKADILKHFDETLIEYLQKPRKIPEFISRLECLHKELDILKNSLHQGIKKEKICERENVKLLFQYIQDSSDIITEMKLLCDIYEMILDMEQNHSTQNYSESLKTLRELENIMVNTKSLIVLKYLRKTVPLNKSSMFHKFHQFIKKKYVTTISDQKSVSNLKVEEDIDIVYLMQNLFTYNNHIRIFDNVIDFLWEFVFVPIVTCSTKVLINENELTVAVTKKHTKQNYAEVFKKLYRVNYFLQTYFNFILDESKNFTLLEYIGNHLKDRLSPLLITHCLKNIRCSNNENLDYEKIIQETEQLEIELKFLKLSDGAILEYAKNLNEIHMNKRCEVFLNLAKVLISQKNTEITQVGALFLNNEVDNTSDFPCISISSNVQELLQLTEKILMEMKSGSEICLSKLFQTILEIFDYFMKYSGKQDQEMIPKEIALFHNNCNYISHELRNWNIFYFDIFSSSFKTPPFKDTAFQLQTIGEEFFNNFVRIQSNKLENFLNEGLTHQTKLQFEIGYLSEKSVEKCLSHLKYLKDSWYNILSSVVYNKTIGVLLNVLCDFFIKAVLNSESIQTNVIEKLANICDFIVNSVPTYFLESTNVQSFVNCWEKLKALSFVLNSDLVEIETNWFYDDSFLKLNFKTNAMKSLIKALFQDSDRRESLLLKILGVS